MLTADTLDDPLVPDGDGAWQGGQVSSRRRNLLQPGEAFAMVNIDLGKAGRPGTRRGTDNLGELSAGANIVQGLGYFDVPSLERLVMVCGGLVTQYDETTQLWTSTAGFTPDAEAPIDIVQGNNKLFLSNGVDNMRSWDGTTFTDLGTGGTNAPKAAILLWMAGQLIASGIPGDETAVWFNNVLADGAAGTWPVEGRTRVGEGDGDPIVALVRWNRFLIVVLKRSSVWTINADPTVNVSEMEHDCISDSIGCVARRSVVRVGNDVWFLSDRGVHSLRRVLTAEENEVTIPLSEPIQDVIEDINEAAMHTAAATFYGNRYLLAAPTGDAVQPNVVAPYNTQTKCWMGRWTGWAPTVFAVSQFAGLKRLQFGQADGTVWRWRDYTKEGDEASLDFLDGGEIEYETTLEGRAYLFGSARHWKNGVDIEAEFNESRAKSVEITPIIDEAEQAPLATVNSGLAELELPITFPISFTQPGIKRVNETLMHLDRFRELAIKISAERGKLALRSLTVTAQMDGADL